MASLMPTFTTKNGAGAHNLLTMFDARANDQLNIMTPVPIFPVSRTQAPNVTVETLKDILPPSPTIPPTDELNLNVSHTRDSL